MINSFISLVARDIIQTDRDGLKDLAVIFPNRRSGALFSREMVGQLETPTWSPGIFSIDDWLIGLSGLEKADRLVLLALLFRVVKRQLPDTGEFADFIDLGETILSDFDDVDKYLVDPQKLFSSLNEIKKIDHQFDITSDEELVERVRIFWTSFGSRRSSHQEKWLDLWDKLLPVYLGYRNDLIDKGLGTSGICYRKAAEDLLGGKTGIPGRYKKFVFVGFNILTTVEEDIFNYLKNKGVARFYWDYHPYYLNEPFEAGKFVSHFIELFPPPAGFHPFPEGSGDFFKSPLPDDSITVIPVTSNTGQVQALLNDIRSRHGINRGIVLSDENLFSDLLSSWPDETLPVNFTSGYPLRDTQAAGLFSTLINVFLDLNLSIGHRSCKTSLVLAFLRHPWVQWLTGNPADPVIQQIMRRYPDSVPAEFIDHDDSLSPWIGTLKPDIRFPDRLASAGNRLLTFESLFSHIEKAAIDLMIAHAGILQGIINRYDLPPDPKSLSKLFLQFLNTKKISLETNRDAANQVTGILETRLVDFDEVYILSFNEGIWPSKSLPGSLIPFSMRRIFNLPTAENRDAMYAYYFYRLIQRAKSVYLYYLTGHRDDSISTGEKSRFITQLQYEFPRKIKFRPEPPIRVGPVPGPVVVRKEGIVLERLHRYLSKDQDAKSLSPSAINEFMDCSLRFALRRIFDFREPDEIAFASDPKGFGILIHQVMHRLYREFVGKDAGPDSEWLQRTIDSRDSLGRVVLDEYQGMLKQHGDFNPAGKELLAMEVVRQFLIRILEFDQQVLPGRILGLEKEFRLEYAVQSGEQTVLVNLNGIIDRIDTISEGIRILDYKTGNCDLNAKSVSDLFNQESYKRPKEVFQVLMYCEFYLRSASVSDELLPGLFRLGRFRAGETDYRVQLDGSDIRYSDIRDEFNGGLKSILENIFNPDIPFVQTENLQVCRYCPFKGICSRENYS